MFCELNNQNNIVRLKYVLDEEVNQKDYFNKASSPLSRYDEFYDESMQDPDKFFGRIANCVTWYKPWTKVLDDEDPTHTKWFAGGELNACYNTVDRHVIAGKGNKVAIIHDNSYTNDVRRVTYQELYQKVSLLAGALSNLGVTKGDRVLIYMPTIPETAMAILATARLGAVHAMVFGGFAARELSVRIDHTKPKVIIAANCGLEPGKVIHYKDNLHEALNMSTHQPNKVIIFQRKTICTTDVYEDMDVLDWEEALGQSEPHECVPIEANEPLYILYTSGTTGQPKGVQRPVGGHLVSLAWSMEAIYGMTSDDIWWSTSDLGWVVGHSYICYAPLLCGMTTIMFEGKPVRTTDSSSYFRIINDYKVSGLFTIPTALRAIKREYSEVHSKRHYSTRSLKAIFVAGECCDKDTILWAEYLFKVPVLNHWWQTETGHAITATCIGLHDPLDPPIMSAGKAVPGYNIQVVRSDGSSANIGELGRIVIKLPLPPGNLSTLYNAHDRFIKSYLQKYPGYYDTMDAGYKDKDGYIYVTAREDDVINVAGHRISTSAIEDVILAHPDIVDAAVVGVPDDIKGEVPLCLYVTRNGAKSRSSEINKDLVKTVRNMIGPIAFLRLVASVNKLPRTRSGKVLRKSISDMAKSKPVKISANIEDPSVYQNIKEVLQSLGFAINAPDPV